MPAPACTRRPAKSASGRSRLAVQAHRASPPRARMAQRTLRARRARPPLTTTASAAPQAGGAREGTRREPPPIAEATLSVDHHDLAIARQGVVLQAVIAHDHVAARLGQKPRSCRPIAADGHRRMRPRREQHRLVADHAWIVRGIDQTHGGGGAAIAARHDARPKAPLAQPLDEPMHERGLARSADAQVADDHHGHRQARRRVPAPRVRPAAQARCGAIQQRQRPQPPWRRRPCRTKC